MPSIIPSYIYTLFASIIVGTLVITSCALATVNVKEEAEKQQLSNIADYVAAKCMGLLASSPSGNLSIKLPLDVPPLIGSQQYWVQIQNDSARAWVELGFGTTVVYSETESDIPSEVYASGFCLSSSAQTFLECKSNETGCYLTLIGGS